MREKLLKCAREGIQDDDGFQSLSAESTPGVEGVTIEAASEPETGAVLRPRARRHGEEPRCERPCAYAYEPPVSLTTSQRLISAIYTRV